ncbi:MAG TPA: PspA/IM30 family protein [Firmicutes bacterium]|nr:PspA/IM30 family protein [Bacillota bacterium]
MGLMSRMTTIFKSRMNKILDRLEDPRVTLDYSYEKQLELLQKVRRSLADVLAAKKRLELQKARVEQEMSKLEEQAKEALRLNREDLALAALERKQSYAVQVGALDSQIQQLDQEYKKLEATQQRLQQKVDAFRSQKELIKAQYSAAEAQVKIGEATSGLSEELADVGLALERAQEKTENLRARAAAIDEMIDAGALPDYTAGTDKLQQELTKEKMKSAAALDLERLKKEVSG